ncbi:adenylate/guanylate cyclase domain-containing protein [Xanthomarina spongicola]|uniref:Adenylate cyclase n=1 Tax=Xanthomarina spongicola TaxID=570520 RepID=A0A316EAG3_9FLAO|nr:adenylate/guanylate cyclase domain-containing protein [Xanthomarina spongicola]PWK19900.1 class 3 adenylate cyclase [Xanthomarina spongicola]
MCIKHFKAYYLLIGCFYFFIQAAYSQEQKQADSLKTLYNTGDYKESELEILSSILMSEINPDTLLHYSDLLIDKATPDSINHLKRGYLNKGYALSNKGNNVEALQYFLKCLELNYQLKDEQGIGAVLISIADTYSIMENKENATEYYNKGIQIIRKLNDSIPLGSALLNSGDNYFHIKKYEEALSNFKESGTIFKNINFERGTAYNTGNIGMVYTEQGKYDLAKTYLNEAISSLEPFDDYYAISVYLLYLSDIYAEEGNLTEAFNNAKRSLELSSSLGLKDQISDANLKLSRLYEDSGNIEDSYTYFKNHIIYRDSVNNIHSVQAMADLRTNFEVSQKQIQVDLLNQQKKNQRIIVYSTFAALLALILFAFGLYRRFIYVRSTKKIIEQEKERSDNLLLNILPEETAQELKLNGKVQAKKFESVTVLFTDFKDFTHYAENLSPEKLVESIDFYFSKFDAIIEKHGLEKIKTIGDAYMCAGGLHNLSHTHANTMILAAFEILEFVSKSKLNNPENLTRYDIRIGIHTGPVVAGIVGTKKFSYDIWGDTVNIASRMETNSEPGKINISENTYSLIKDSFACEYRGKMKVKNRGLLNMYFVYGMKDGNEFSKLQTSHLTN